MNTKRAALIAVALAMASASGGVWADRGGHYGGQGGYHGGGHYGGGLGWVPGLLLGSALVWAVTRPTVVYQEPVQTVVVPEPVMVAPPSPPPSNQYWYYCRSSGTYYPYVSSCPTGWERVPATP